MTAREKRRKWYWARRSVQVLALAFFLYLLLANRSGETAPLPGDLFFRLDPLTSISSMLAARQFLAPMLLALLTIGLTLALGRAWCGWICPMGTVVEVTSPRRRNPPGPPSPWRQAKNLVLAGVLAGAVLGSLSLIVLDPLTILYRTITSGVMPGLNMVVTEAETYLYRFQGLQGFLDSFDGFVRGTFLPMAEPYFVPSVALLIILAAIMALNALRPRFWCRYLCPLGALLGLISRISAFRRSVDAGECNSCGRCARECPVNAIDPARDYASDPAECTVCLSCLEGCPVQAIEVKKNLEPSKPELEGLTRRQALGSLGIMLGGVALLRLAPSLRGWRQTHLRPPGSREQDMAARCIRCGTCINVCPTRAIHPTGAGTDGDNLWTPVLVPRKGFCDYTCNRCGQACPSGAIPELGLPEKQATVIGKAEIDTTRCVPWAQGTNCIVCQEMCPLPVKAIQIEEVTVAGSHGTETVVGRPVMVRERCIGCGLCENKCPVPGKAAIRVYPQAGPG